MASSYHKCAYDFQSNECYYLEHFPIFCTKNKILRPTYVSKNTLKLDLNGIKWDHIRW